jgi:hypothetical protein
MGRNFFYRFVLHKCDIGICVNPEHLFIGTQHDNMIDKNAKGRGNRKCFHQEGGTSKKHCATESLNNVGSNGYRACGLW